MKEGFLLLIAHIHDRADHIRCTKWAILSMMNEGSEVMGKKRVVR